ncbi:MAG: AtpZ/AtpI family protein [Syntrophobacteria bacterium]
MAEGSDSEKRRERFEEDLKEKVGSKELRKLKARREEQRGIWFGLGMFGLVGWSVAIPTLIGIAVGVWLDCTFADGYSWSLMGLFIGVVLGCLNAWYWVKRESRRD